MQPPRIGPAGALPEGGTAPFQPGEAELTALRRSLVRLAASRAHDPQTAQDIAQETLTRALARDGAFLSAAHLTGWAVTTCQHLCVQHWRSAQRHAPGQLPADLADPRPPVDADQLTRDLMGAIGTALRQMPDRQAAVLLAAAELGSADRGALALATGENLHAVRNYLHRGRAALRSHLAAVGQGSFALAPWRAVLRSGPGRGALVALGLLPVLALGLLHGPDRPPPPGRPTGAGPLRWAPGGAARATGGAGQPARAGRPGGSPGGPLPWAPRGRPTVGVRVGGPLPVSRCVSTSTVGAPTCSYLPAGYLLGVTVLGQPTGMGLYETDLPCSPVMETPVTHCQHVGG